VLRVILRHCGVRKVRLIPQDLRAMPAALFTKPSYLASFSTFYEFIKEVGFEEKNSPAFVSLGCPDWLRDN
jgi:hypothetical protein